MLRGEAESALEEVQNALAQQEAFAADVEERLNAKLAEAESLRTFDTQLADQLVREQAEVAARLREAGGRRPPGRCRRRCRGCGRGRGGACPRPRPPRPWGGGGGGGGDGGGGGGGGPAPSVIAPAPGGLATVTCPYGGSIQVAGSIAGNVQALLDAAAAQGVSLCASSGWRSPERRSSCGGCTAATRTTPST